MPSSSLTTLLEFSPRSYGSDHVLIMTLESSCDETSAALIRDGKTILSNAISSQIPIHRRFGGVVPELASRNHVLAINQVIDDALSAAGHTLQDLDAIGVTSGPGLTGSLLVGIETAKALAYALDIPCVGLNHLEGHLTAVLLEHAQSPVAPEFPYIGLVASGGHSDLYLVRGMGDYTILGRTRDDAAGEAFDKVAKMLGLPYPGGVEIDRLAAQGDPEAIDFPRPMWTRKNLDFSFAGLKTAVLTHLQTHGTPAHDSQEIRDVCASFQAAVVDVLVMKTIAAATQQRVTRLILSGGVACNSQLRAAMKERAAKKNLKVFLAPPALCTDNAAMLGPAAHHRLQGMDTHEGFTQFDLQAESSMPLGLDARKKVSGPHR